jgi:hypothetical protein
MPNRRKKLPKPSNDPLMRSRKRTMKSPRCPTLARSAWLTLPLILLLAGCGPMRIVTKPVPDCTAWRYITVGNDDVLTDPTARQIVANDKDWLRLCGKAPTPPATNP